MCEGGTSCEVSAGTYQVINHSTGEIFFDVVVGDSGSTPTPLAPAPGVDRVTVDGTTISWPDNGWYQVQNAETFASVCEGGTSCEVAPGSYIVINHSEGTRENVIVAGTGVVLQLQLIHQLYWWTSLSWSPLLCPTHCKSK